MTILEECKVSLRTTTTDADLVAKIESLIDTVRRDITLADADESWIPAEPTDPVIRQCIVCFVCWMYFNDIDTAESDKWLKAYNIFRNKIHNRSVYQEVAT